MAGLPLFVGRNEEEVDYFKHEIETILEKTLSSIKLKENGVSVQASTLGSLEALLEFLKTSNIPVSSDGEREEQLDISLHFSTLQSILDLSIDEISFEHPLNLNAKHSKRRHSHGIFSEISLHSRWAVVLAFDVRIEKDAQDYADNTGK